MRERPAWRRLPGSIWRLAMLVRSARDLLAPHAPLLPLLSGPFLIATLVSALLVPVAVAALVVLLAAAAAYFVAVSRSRIHSRRSSSSQRIRAMRPTTRQDPVHSARVT
jgi:membrane protein implicated in regulation of membrane protease activity